MGTAVPGWTDQLVLAVHEVVTNVIRHAYDEQAGHPIRLSLSTDATSLTVRLSHEGTPYTPPDDAAQEDQRPPIDELPAAGFGLYLIRNNVDAVVYDTDPARGTSQVTLRKRFQRRSADGRASMSELAS